MVKKLQSRAERSSGAVRVRRRTTPSASAAAAEDLKPIAQQVTSDKMEQHERRRRTGCVRGTRNEVHRVIRLP